MYSSIRLASAVGAQFTCSTPDCVSQSWSPVRTAYPHSTSLPNVASSGGRDYAEVPPGGLDTH